MRNRAARRCLILLLLLLISMASQAGSNEPTPRPAEVQKPPQTKGSEPKAQTQSEQERAKEPIAVIKEAPSKQTENKAAKNTDEADNKTSSDWWMVWLTVILAFIAFLQLIVFGLQARRLRQTIVTMKELGEKQSADMQGWIAVADKSASAAKEAADAATASAGVAKHTLIASHRAWMKIEACVAAYCVVPGAPISSGLSDFEA
jgi:hypothetical protein